MIKLIALLSVNTLAIIDKLLGSWAFILPYQSWGITGFFAGALIYFALHEADRLNRPNVKQILVVASCGIIAMTPIVGPMTHKAQKLSTQETITNNYPLKVEFTVESTTRYPVPTKKIMLPRAGFYEFDVYDKSIFTKSASTSMYPLLIEFDDYKITTDKTPIFEGPISIDKPCAVSIKYTSAYAQNLKAYLRIRELTIKPEKFRTIRLNKSGANNSGNEYRTKLKATSDSPLVPYEDHGACPFECCTYREWFVKKDTNIFQEMNEHSPIAFQVDEGEKVTGETGVVITTKIGNATLLKEINNGVQIPTGTIVPVLSYAGEGFFKIWHKGKVLTTQDIEMKNKPETIWWVKIRNNAGQSGWSNQPDNFGNKDACG